MGSGGSSSSKSSSAPTAPSFINPVTGILANLFGAPVGLSSRTGGLVLGQPGTSSAAAGNISSLFGPGGARFSGDSPFGFGSSGAFDGSAGGPLGFFNDAGQFFRGGNDILSGAQTGVRIPGLGLTQGFGPGSGEGAGGRGGAPFNQLSGQAFFADDFLSVRDQLQNTAGLGQGFGPEFEQGLARQAVSDFQNTVLPGAQELAETGFRTSASDVIRNDLLPQLREDSAFLGGSGFESDLNANIIRQSLSAQVGLDEAAAGRRAEGLGFLQGLPLDFGADIGAFEAGARDRELQGREGNQVLNLLFAAAGLPSDFTAGQQSTSKSKSLQVGILT